MCLPPVFEKVAQNYNDGASLVSLIKYVYSAKKYENLLEMTPNSHSQLVKSSHNYRKYCNTF